MLYRGRRRRRPYIRRYDKTRVALTAPTGRLMHGRRQHLVGATYMSPLQEMHNPHMERDQICIPLPLHDWAGFPSP